MSNVGVAFENLKQYDKAIEFHTKDLNISFDLGDRDGEERAKSNLEDARNGIIHQAKLRIGKK